MTNEPQRRPGMFAVREDGTLAGKQERHHVWREENMKALRASGLTFTEHATSVSIREPGRPSVEFYPDTGRWRVVKPSHPTMHRGGARSFIGWYAKQSTARNA